jgi:hypothetical protein
VLGPLLRKPPTAQSGQFSADWRISDSATAAIRPEERARSPMQDIRGYCESLSSPCALPRGVNQVVPVGRALSTRPSDKHSRGVGDHPRLRAGASSRG